MQVGFFDSGIGGLTVLYDSLRLLPELEYLYYADIENVPMGPKAKSWLRSIFLLLWILSSSRGRCPLAGL